MRVRLLRNCLGPRGDHLARGSEHELPDSVGAQFVRRKYAVVVESAESEPEEKPARKAARA